MTSATAAPPADVRELVPMRTHVCLPGDPVLHLGPRAVVAVGEGLREQPRAAHSGASPVTDALLTAEYAAPVRRTTHKHGGIPRYDLECPSNRRYQYRPGDPIVVLIAKKLGAYYQCFTGGSGIGYLDALAFDGATKVSRPRLVEGDVVYCYVKRKAAANYLDHNVPDSHGVSAVNHAAGGQQMANVACDGGEVELSCMAAEVGLPPKDWTSGEAVFGPLEGGRVLTLPLPYVRSLLAPLPTTTGPSARKRHRAETAGEEEADAAVADAQEEVPASYLLSLLGQRVPFEMCVGVNGLVWVKGAISSVDATAAARRTVAISTCIEEAQYDASRVEMEARVESYFPSTA